MEDGTFIIGRENPHGQTGRRGGGYLELRHPTVSRRHAELIALGGTYHLRDLGSTNGTWIIREGGPEPFREGYVDLDTPLRLGECACTLAQLIGSAR